MVKAVSNEKTAVAYVFKIEIEKKIWQKIKVDSNITFNDLHHIIQKMLGMNHDGYYSFFMDGKLPEDSEGPIYHKVFEKAMLEANQYSGYDKLLSYPFYPRKKFSYAFKNTFIIIRYERKLKENIKRPIIIETFGDIPLHPCSIFKLVHEMENRDNDIKVFLDIQTNQFLDLQTTFFKTIDTNQVVLTSWQARQIELAKTIIAFPERYIELPSKKEINEKKIINDFIEKVIRKDYKKVKLEKLINSNANETQYKKMFLQIKLWDAWMRYYRARLAEIARKWCDFHSVKYTNDIK